MLARFLLAVLLSCLSIGASATRPPPWTFIELNGPAATQTVAAAVNNRGQVAGWFSSNSCFCEQAFLWDNGVFQPLPLPEGVRNVRVRGMNDDGTLVGHTVLDGTYAMMWKDGAWSRLGFQGEAVRINKSGSIAGTLRNREGYSRGFLLKDGMLFELGTFGGVQSNVMDLNDRDRVVGSADRATGEWNAFLWDNGAMTNLGTLGGSYSFANSLNNRGVVVGYSFTADRVARAFTWDQFMQPLLNVANTNTAWAINDRGTVVGMIDDAGTQSGFVFDGNTLTRLKDIAAVKSAGWKMLFPLAINERGWITGYGQAADGSYRGFLLVPR
jgi:probable HAF family extracellular repeat protein